VLEADAGGSELRASVRRLRIRIEHRRDHSVDLIFFNKINTRRRAPLMAARFQVDVHCRPRGTGSGLVDGDHLGVRTAGLFVPAFANDGFALREDAADARIRRRGKKALLRKRERPRHHGVVERGKTGHLRLRRGDFTSCTASRNSSGDSKLRYTEAKRM